MAALGLIPTHLGNAEDVNSVQVSINAANFSAYPRRIETGFSAFVLMPIAGTPGRSASVAMYPYSMSFGFRRSIGNRGHRGRNTKSIRGLAQNSSASGIQRDIYAVHVGEGDTLGVVLAYARSAVTTGVFDLRIPDDQPTLIFMKPNDGETKNAVILEDVLPVDPV